MGGVRLSLNDVPPHVQRAIVNVIDAHIPSLTDEDEALVYERVTRFDESVTAADYALRTCSCGARIDGFYEYIDHLKARLKGAGLIDASNMGTLPNGGEA